jgi:nucleoside-diphosphate-sugar epimerase
MGKVLVVGANGFVGTELIKQLKEHGDKILALDNRTITDKTVDSVLADITNVEGIKKALDGREIDIIYHLASLPGDSGNPYDMINVNISGLQNMLEWARANPVKRYVLASSICAYQWYPVTKFIAPDYLPVDEKHPCSPKDMYSTTKRMQELLALTYCSQYKVPVTVLRLTVVVGPDGKGGGIGWREFAKKLRVGKKVQIPYLTPEELCHYVDLRDVGRMSIVVAEHPDATGEIFNCCAAEPTLGSEFVQIVKKLVPGIEVECDYPLGLAQGGQISFSMEKAKKILGYEPKYTFADAVKSVTDWINAGGLIENQ